MATGNNNNAETGQSDLQASEDLEELTCQPCHNRGRLEKAVGMCNDCQEYLCQRCYDAHTIPTPIENHELLGKEQMLKSQCSFKRKDKCNDKCYIHDDDIIKFYCIDHCLLCCGVCISLNHRSCDKVSYIPDVAKDIANNEEYKHAEAQLKSVFAQSKRVKKTTQDQTKAIQDHCLEAIEMVQGFRRDINIALDKIENGLIEETESLKSEEIEKVEDIADKYKDAGSDLQSAMEMLEKFRRNEQKCSVYTVMMKLKNRLASLESKIQAAEREQSLITNKIKFVPDKDILNTLRSPKALGIICVSKTPDESETDQMTLRRVEHMGNRNVKSMDDKDASWITGSVILSDNRLLISDHKNKAFKMADIHGNIIIRLSLSSKPWDVTIINDNQIAVALPYEKTIAIVSVTASTMSVERSLPIGGNCYGVCYRDDKLAVALNSQNKVQVLDLHGSVLHSIVNDKKGQAIFSNPYYVIFGRDNTTLYVSNDGYNNVVCVKCDGTVVATYTDSKLTRPRGVTIDNIGNVYVCSKDSNQILQFTSDGKTIKTVIAETDGLVEPYSLSYNETNHTFYVGVWNSCHSDNDTNTIKLYKAIFD